MTVKLKRDSREQCREIDWHLAHLPWFISAANDKNTWEWVVYKQPKFISHSHGRWESKKIKAPVGLVSAEVLFCVLECLPSRDGRDRRVKGYKSLCPQVTEEQQGMKPQTLFLHLFIYLFIYLFITSECWTQGLMHPKQAFCHWAKSTTPPSSLL
jgi:hypothetical protein